QGEIELGRASGPVGARDRAADRCTQCRGDSLRGHIELGHARTIQLNVQLGVTSVAGVLHVGQAWNRGHRGDDLIRNLVERVQIWSSELNVDAGGAATAETATTAERA